MNRYAPELHGFAAKFQVCLLLCLFALSAATAGFASESQKKLLIGIEPEHNIFDQMARYRHLAEYVSDRLGIQVSLTIMSRYGEVIKRFKARRLDGAFLTSYTATLGIEELGLEPVVNPVNLNGESTSQGYIFVRKDSGIRTIQDMRGKNMVFVDPVTTEGYLFAMAFLLDHGISDATQFFNRLYFSGSHASAIFTVLDGRADIGSVKDTVFVRMVRKDPSIGHELKIIARSPSVPEFTLCVRSEIDRDIREKLAMVLLDMNQTPEGREVLKQFKALKFVRSSKTDFAEVGEMARQVRAVVEEHTDSQ